VALFSRAGALSLGAWKPSSRHLFPLPVPAVNRVVATPTTESLAPVSRTVESLAPVSRAPVSRTVESRAPVSRAPVSRTVESLAPVSRAPVSLAPRAPVHADRARRGIKSPTRPDRPARHLGRRTQPRPAAL
jgi:hypothetical protein